MDILQKQDLAAASFANDNTNAAGGLAVRTDAGSTVGAAITAATPDATTAVKGLVELATVAETPTLDTVRAVTPEGFTTTLAAKTAVANTGASRVGFLQQGVGAVGRTLQDRGEDRVSIFDFMTPAQKADVSAGTTVLNVTTPLQLALDSGFKVVDFLGLLSKCDQLTVPANVHAKNVNLKKATAGGNLVLVNTGSKITGVIEGTGTTSILERGVYPAANNVTDVVFDLEVKNMTFGVHGQPLAGTAYADAPKRWSGFLKFTGITGTAGTSEGYGVLLSPSYDCVFDVISKSPNARHVVYLSAGASNNNVNVTADGCANYCAQISSTAMQDACENNTINMHFSNLSETVAGESGAAALLGKVNYNTITVKGKTTGGVSHGVLVEGSSSGPYPIKNKIINGAIQGTFMGAEVIRMINADSTTVSGNSLDCTGSFAVIAMRTAGVNGSSHGGFIYDNIIDAKGVTVRGVYNECSTQPSFIGLNEIGNNGAGLRVDDQTAGNRQGFSRRVRVSGTTPSIPAADSGDTTAVLPIPIQNTGRVANVVTTGSSGTYFSFPHTLIGMLAGTDSQLVFRFYNGAPAAQTFNFVGVVEGD